MLEVLEALEKSDRLDKEDEEEVKGSVVRTWKGSLTAFTPLPDEEE